MKKKWTHKFWFTPRFFLIGSAALVLCAFGFVHPLFFGAGRVVLGVLVLCGIADAVLLFRPSTRISAKRNLPNLLNLDEDTPVSLQLSYPGKLPLRVRLIDELPAQLQIRNFEIKGKAGPSRTFTYSIRPIGRGTYGFGDLNVFLESPLALIRRRIKLPLAVDVPVYPNIAGMHRAELKAFNRMNTRQGEKVLNRIGRSYEFEQITPFSEGDDYRSINWKATGKARTLMTNRYRDERSQNLYCIISKGRSMKMAFRHLTYLDHAINATLAVSNIALKNYDNAGLITFSNRIGSALKAENRPGQIRKIIDALYAERERSEEPNYALLHRSVMRLAPSRSMILFFAHFDSAQTLEAALPTLREISRKHLLIAVMFEDPEPVAGLEKQNKTVEDVYRATLIRQHVHSGRERALRLRRNGIQTLVCDPRHLSAEVINKYLDMKSLGLI